MKLAIIGCGDLGKQIAHYAKSDMQLEVVGYFDDYQEKGVLVDGDPVLGGREAVLEAFEDNIFDALAIGIGYRHFDFRAAVFEQFQGKVPFATLIHPSCTVDSKAELGEGVVLFPGAIVDVRAVLEDNVLLNVGAVVTHDAQVGKHSFLAPSVSVAAYAQIGQKCNLGTNTTVIDKVVLADNIQTGGGTVVIDDLSEKGLYVGNPQRFVR